MMSQDELDKLLESGPDEGGEEGGAAPAEAPQADGADKPEEGGGAAAPEADVDWEAAFEEAAKGGDEAAQKAVQKGAVSAESAESKFDEFAAAPPKPAPSQGEPHPDIDFILDIPLDVSVELGRTKLQIKDLLQLTQGSVVELNKMAGEPAEIYVNQRLMAKGEIVVVNERFGVRLTEIISPAERVKSLG